MKLEPMRDARRAAHLLLLAGALGCGGMAGEDEQPVVFPSLPRSDSAPPRPTAIPDRPPPAAPSTPPDMPLGDTPSPAAVREEQDFVTAENILIAYCGSCHGPAAPIETSGGLRFIDDMDRMVDAGLIIVLGSDISPLIVRIRDGSMPPPASGLPPMASPDLQILIRFIDEPRFWPAPPEPPLEEPADAGLDPPRADTSADAG